MIEDKRALMFMGIVIAFILCHLPRVILDLHEIFTLEYSNYCMTIGSQNTIPSWVFVGKLSYNISIVFNNFWSQNLVFCMEIFQFDIRIHIFIFGILMPKF